MIENTRFKDLAVSDTGFIFDPYSGATFTVNETGLRVVQALRDGSPLRDIVNRLQSGFEGVTGDVGDDVGDFLRALKQNGLLPDDFEAK